MTTAIIGTGGLGSVIARQLASGGETLRLSSADTESARTLAAQIGHAAVAADGNRDALQGAGPSSEQVAAAYPDVLVAVRAQRAFLARAVHFLVTEAGIRQFLDIGTGLPSANNTHQVAQRAAPASRVVYVDNDPGAIIGRLMDAVPPGSYLAISQIASDVAADEVAEGVQRNNAQAAAPVAARLPESRYSSILVMRPSRTCRYIAACSSTSAPLPSLPRRTCCCSTPSGAGTRRTIS
jgi:S-adenosyl methyltransferase